MTPGDPEDGHERREHGPDRVIEDLRPRQPLVATRPDDDDDRRQQQEAEIDDAEGRQPG